MERYFERQRERRRITVSAVGTDGRAVPATIKAFVDGTEIGSIILAFESITGTIELAENSDTIQLFATCHEINRAIAVNTQQNAYQFTFPVSAEFLSGFKFQQAEAQCPDGTTGSPCVVCNIEGKPYRLCV